MITSADSKAAATANLVRSGPDAPMWEGAVLWAAWALATIVVMLVLTATGPVLLGDRVYVVTGGSMEPAIPLGSSVTVDKVDWSELQVGDAITFVTRKNEIVTHRVVGQTFDEHGPAFTTRGDANEDTDEEMVRPVNIIGRVWYHLPLVGYVMYFASQTLVRAAVVLLALVIIGSEMGWVSFGRKKVTAEEQAR